VTLTKEELLKHYAKHMREKHRFYNRFHNSQVQVKRLKDENARLREAIKETIARADDYADSWISKPVREAHKEKS
jgi:hypothetical protein